MDIVKLEVVTRVTGMPVLDVGGQLRKNVRLLPTLTANGHVVSAQERRPMALHGYVASLKIMLSQHRVAPTSVMGKMHAYASGKQHVS